MPNRKPSNEPHEDRQAMLRELRERYLNGTINDVLVPDEIDLTNLLEDLQQPEETHDLREVAQLLDIREEIA